ncbi:PP2C family protein-serine/threonine phosphatase [Streptomyces olivaceus]|uniref:PP2C family protein-serine/threonine phosphatase n=1 Tax=Streptomyces olivaceus TaxID=47716 RepID=UPI000878D330|nr:SpoIIE family protein phosphatase [Streptomyces olivaceus]AOW88084.1 histidine kinase [Streptomyces olivaceus]MBZ6194174.1 SpoIIE family protein phosphatase [Streptomyces olivaceus]MBZ6200933.1 SpoIIE family protein phosphatase [Streptomyces olivaceus]MBZ6205146.1 SpoIIE family protein phosphatase [Streptomyces olivaceus]MBZ6290826.1 SpoIIE family protein phosphatase [Streptomyces olivaceus]
MSKVGDQGEKRGRGEDREPVDEQARFSALLEDSAEDLYEHAPCGYLSTLLDGRIAKINTTLLDWLGYEREELVGRRRFSDLLTVGGRLYHETHFAPLLHMQGEVKGIALDLKAADGSRLPVMVTSTVKSGGDGQPLLIRTTVFDARDRRAYETELLRARKEADLERDRLKDLNTTLQRTLLPPVLVNVPGLDISAHYHIASVDEVGGDFYDLFPLAAGTWGLFLGDVCGKGAAAAAVTSLARYTLRAAAVYDPDPAAVLANLNTVLNHEYNGTDPRFCTVVFGLLTPDEDRGGFRITLASGGHPPAMLMASDGTAGFLHTPGGQLMGVLPDAHIATTSVHLAPGDTLLLHTDGLTEAHTAATGGERYGDDALLDFGRDLAPTTASGVIDAIRDLLDTFGTGVDDDTAVLAIHVPRTPSEEQK